MVTETHTGNQTGAEPGIAHAEISHPMESPAPVLAVIAAVAILVIGGLMATEFIWAAQNPVTIAHTPATHPTPPAG